MTDEGWLDPQKAPSNAEVAFDYVKSPDFKMVWADGVIGSPTPNGLLHFALYAERPAIPRRQVFALDRTNVNGSPLGAEVIEKQISRSSIVREMSVDVLLTAQAAESLGKWLISQAEEIMKMQEKKV